MASDRFQRRIERLLDEADEAISRYDWEAVRQAALAVLAIDPDNADGQTFLAKRVASCLRVSMKCTTSHHFASRSISSKRCSLSVYVRQIPQPIPVRLATHMTSTKINVQRRSRRGTCSMIRLHWLPFRPLNYRQEPNTRVVTPLLGGATEYPVLTQEH